MKYFLRYVTSLASIFSGGLASGIHMTNSAEAVTFVVEDAPVDILILEDEKLLRKVIRGYLSSRS